MAFFERVHQRLLAPAAARGPMETALLLLLVPLSLLYGGIARLRQLAFAAGLRPVYRSPLPVVSVGNMTVGGTGKTPVVDRLVKSFLRDGKRPVVISRGYAGTYSGPVGLVSDGKELLLTAVEAGDEPYLLARRNPDCPVLIAKKRVAAVKYVEHNIPADVIVLDDGFQHLALGRKVDVLLLDAERPLGNGWPLPAGNLREFPGSLQRADFLIMTRAGQPQQSFWGRAVYNSCHCLADTARDLDGTEVRLDDLKKMRLAAFAGIGKPESFFSALEAVGLGLAGKIFLPDHADYRQRRTMEKLRAASAGIDAYITTEKDAVKLSSDQFDLPCYQLGVNIDIENYERLWKELVAELRS